LAGVVVKIATFMEFISDRERKNIIFVRDMQNFPHNTCLLSRGKDFTRVLFHLVVLVLGGSVQLHLLSSLFHPRWRRAQR
jgi:hypothetical protein